MPIILFKPHDCLMRQDYYHFHLTRDQTLMTQQGRVTRPRTLGFYCHSRTYLGSTELDGLDFAGDATLGSSPELPEDPGRESCTDPDWFGSTSRAEVRRCSLSLTSFSRDLALCSARRRSNCFFLPGTALRWLNECV